MSRLERLMGKPKEFEIGGEKLLIHPLTLEHINLMMDAGQPETQAKSIKEIIEITLKKSVPDSTEEEINGFGMQNFEELFKAISEVNGMEKKSDGTPNKIKEHIKQIQEARK